MNDFAIRVEGLSERCRFGRRETYQALRDILASAAAALLRLWYRSAEPGCA